MHDKRLDARLLEILSQLSDQPTASIPAACGGYNELTAAYRFFDNPRVTPEKILASHSHSAQRRIQTQQHVILAQDTTEIELTRPTIDVRGAGPLDQGSRQGAFLHLLHAFTANGTPLGTVYAQMWARAEPTVKVTTSEKQRKSKHTPLADKESCRWVDTLQAADRVARGAPDTSIVCVADSEADIFELLVAGQSAACDWVVRACRDRALLTESASETTSLFAAAAAGPVLYTQTVQVRAREAKLACETRPRRQSRVSRQAEVAVRATRVVLRPPWRHDQKLPPVEVNVVLAREADAPPGEEPIEWLLLTSLPIDTLTQVQAVIDDYCVRWMVEILFRTLKSGCRIEERRFETLDRHLNCLAVYLIVAWRVLYVCHLGRSCPAVPCDVVFEETEWKAVYRVVQNEPPPDEPVRLQDMVRMVAQLGGYVNKRRSDLPGPQTIWLGLQRARDFARCWQMIQQDVKNGKQLV